MNYILLHQSFGKDSTRLTAAKMTEPCQLLMKRKSGDWVVQDPKTEVVTPVSSLMKRMKEADSIINWGNHIFSNDALFDLNVPSAIRNTSNKVYARRILQNASVAVPRTYFPTTHANLLEWSHTCKYPIIVRPSHHHKGQNFHIFEDGLTLTAFLWEKGDWYASEVFEKTHEFRVYVGHGRVLFVHQKPLVEGEIRANFAVNHETWPVLKWSEHIEIVNIESIRAVEELALDYGAVDIMYNANTGQCAIAEVNTSPQVTTPYTTQKFADYFSWVIRHDYPEHFPIEGKSVFYNNILRD